MRSTVFLQGRGPLCRGGRTSGVRLWRISNTFKRNLAQAILSVPALPVVMLSSLQGNLVNENAAADLDFMRAALEEARHAAARGEVPVGAIVAIEGHVVARSGNRTITDIDPTAHAEMVALREAAVRIGNYRLLDATMYVTIEPCVMCAGAMIQARIGRLVYGAADPKGGAVHSCFSILDHPQLNHRVEVAAGVLAEESVALLRDFFAARR